MPKSIYYEPICLEFRQWLLDNPQDDDEYERPNNWGGYNPNYHTKEMYDEIAEGNRGRKHTEETKQMLREVDRSYSKTKEHKKKVSEGLIKMYKTKQV